MNKLGGYANRGSKKNIQKAEAGQKMGEDQGESGGVSDQDASWVPPFGSFSKQVSLGGDPKAEQELTGGAKSLFWPGEILKSPRITGECCWEEKCLCYPLLLPLQAVLQ
ncbi:hypothetical protein CHARACLAT_015155 [Characodon lateralis]|uniref:Uncharacterized protein n=1 Tax=Characodon lateralis TaxID=208331 RepID=A0ABU7DGS6_9TELE|nr:hypothetical protein [Characodon lateralis]